MALDIAVLDDGGRILRSAPIEAAAHRAIIAAAQSRELPLLLTFADFYEDAEVPPGEVAALLQELDGLARDTALSGVASEELRQLQDLCRFALDAGRGLVAVAD
jgi:hypothetical protein